MKRVENISVVDLIETSFDGAWGTEDLQGNGTPVLRSTDMRDKRMSFSRVARRKLTPNTIKKKVLKTGDVLVNKSSGSARLVGASLLFEHPGDGQEYLCSNFIRCLRPNIDKVLPEFFCLAMQSPQFRKQVFGAQRTTSGLRNLKIKEYLAAKIPVPSISKQGRLILRINELLDRVEKIEDLRSERTAELKTLKLSLLFENRSRCINWGSAGSFVEWVQSSETVEPEVEYNFAGMRSFGRGPFYSRTLQGNEFSYAKVRRLQKDDFIYPKLMAWEGALGMIPANLVDHVVSPEFAVFRNKSDDFRMEVLDTYFRSSLCLRDVRAASTGSNKRRRRLHPREFLKLKVPVPSKEHQEQLVAACRLERECMDTAAETEKEIDALRASILHKAFAGEL